MNRVLKNPDGVHLNVTQIIDALNSGQGQTFTYDAMNRLQTASTNAAGQGQYSQAYAYNPATGNLSNKSDVGVYSYSPARPHAVNQAGSNTYAYDQNGNMTSRMVGGVVWTYSYNAENQLITVSKNNQLVSEYGYDGDGQRVWAKDYEGYLATNPKVTTYIGDYYEVRVEGYIQSTGGAPAQPCSAPSYCSYFPLVAYSHIENISYCYADDQRIAMKNNGVVSYLYGDQLGSTSAVADANVSLVSKTLYHFWGSSRYSQGASPTDYGFTGQMREGDIYFYNARWYDPQVGRFMQADTNVPVNVPKYKEVDETLGYVILQTGYFSPEGINSLSKWNNLANQESHINDYVDNLKALALDRYSYCFNNPLKYKDPSGNSAIPEDSFLSNVLNWSKDNLRVIWHNPPEALKQALFNFGGLRGTRIFMIDKPSANPPYWHFNSDLKLLSAINHKNIEPLLIGIQTLFTKFFKFPGEIFFPIIILPPDYFPPLVPNQITNHQKPIAAHV